jgi:hypothetical protein
MGRLWATDLRLRSLKTWPVLIELEQDANWDRHGNRPLVGSLSLLRVQAAATNSTVRGSNWESRRAR